MARRNGPEFLRFCIPIVEVLHQLGGSGRPTEVTDLVVDRMRIPVEMFEALGLGLRPKTDYDIERPFFDQCR
jgi:hypothetical protein